MGSPDDGALALRIAATSIDGEAEAELCSRFVPRIRLYGLRHLRDEQAADDLVQEVLTQTLSSLRAGRLRDPSMVASFVLGTCRLVVLNQRRTDQRRRAILAESAATPPASVEMEMSEGDRQLAACLAGLSERERTVVVLTYYGELGCDRIAGELALSTGNVRVIRHRALTRLLACMLNREAA